MLISRHGLDEWAPVKPPIRVEERPSLGDKVRVSEIKRTVEIPEVRVTEFFEDG
jgi:hypothetical protein